MAKNLNIGNSSSPVHVNIDEKLMIKSNVVPAISGNATTMGATTVPTYVSNGLIVKASDKFTFWKDVSDSTTKVSIDDYLLRTGGTMIGPLALSADPTAAMQAATKNYVDSKITSVVRNYLPLTGGTLTGVLKTQANSSTWIKGRDVASLRVAEWNQYHAAVSMKTEHGSWELGVYTNDQMFFTYCPDSRYNAGENSGFAQIKVNSGGRLYGAVWNDYAEYREADSLEPGRCVVETGKDTLTLSINRLQPGATIISDTYGFAIGETNKCKTPIAVSGRVLAYPYEDREEFKKNIGRPVCSGPNGTVSIMTDEEYREKGYCAIGTISAVPDYEEWGTRNVKIDGRVWIKVI